MSENDRKPEDLDQNLPVDGQDDGDPSAELPEDDDTTTESTADADAASEDAQDADAADDAAEDAAEEDAEDDELVEMGLLDHLEELRIRLTRCVIAVIVGLFACYGFAEQIFDYLLMPLKPILPEGSTLIFTGLPEGFFTYIKLSAFAGLFLTSPYLFYQIWAFIAPGLYKEERRWGIPVALFSAIFFTAGACFGYFVVFPIAFEFFMGFETELIKPLPSLKEYLSFSLKLLMAFGVAFELPLFIFFLARLGMVSSKWLREKRKYFVLVAFITSAVLTPPDIVSQCFMAGPLIILYELGIVVAWMFGKAEPRKQQAAESES
jgi:sec-independent protein translocase protein TatC